MIIHILDYLVAAVHFFVAWNIVQYNKIEIVRIEDGFLKGNINFTVLNNQKYYSFQGIPYAAPPIERLRFMPPRPVEQWGLNIRDAIHPGNICPQINVRKYLFNQKNATVIGHEDCLFLNVYTPDIRAVKPVMFFIHGGAFMTGSGDDFMYGPDFLIEEDVVLVTINYRLGALGFLSLNCERLSGNFGMKDQVYALQWVQKNIAAFGGDPNNVIIFGHEAGAASANLLMVSPLAQGLFHKVILQSGSFYNGWALNTQNNIAKAYALARDLGYMGTTTELLQFFSKISAKKLVIASELSRYLYLDTLPLHSKPVEYTFSPTIEPFLLIKDRVFLVTDPEKLFTNDSFIKVPLMLGHTDQEFLIYKDTDYDFGVKFFDNVNNPELEWSRKHCKPGDTDCPSNDQLISPYRNLLQKFNGYSFNKIREELRDMYDFSSFSYEKPQKVLQMNSDIWFNLAIERTARKYIELTYNKTYFYQFSYQGAYNLVSHHRNSTYFSGTTNGDELCYQFRCKHYDSAYNIYKVHKPDFKMIRKWTKLLANFARTGEPTPKQEKALNNVIWKPRTPKHPYYLKIDETLRLEVLDEQIFEKWNRLFENIKNDWGRKSIEAVQV